jgi:Na+-transporting NADH:ubiquinone oxidoreductase subunit E
MIFAFFLGMCSYLAVSKTVKTSLGLGLAVTFVLFVTVPVNYLLQTKVLSVDGIFGMDLSYLSFILFIAVIAGIVQLVEMVVEKYSPSLYAALGIFLPLIAVNCAIMGASLFMQQRILIDDPNNSQAIHSIWDAMIYAIGSGIGWTLAIVSLGAIREKMQYCDVPKPLQGLGITFITVGLMAMAMMCFSGLNI